ncbi:helix-turn-helix transcriptional regulator [Paenibacillus sp.]|uniref:AraC family transcriptional regulator n=1 Tax=Paenibacillus sp. TaxID=58172 RepID=UPI00356587BD
MNSFQLVCPPLPHFLICGEDVYERGQRHPSRHSIGVFDLLVVTRGCLYIGEEERQWRLEAGTFLLLRPDRYHYATQGCEEETHFHWLHFQPMGEWSEVPEGAAIPQPFPEESQFVAFIPRFGRLSLDSSVYQQLESLLGMVRRSSVQWKHQIAFQQLLLALGQDKSDSHTSSVYRIAEQTVTYLRMHYREPFRNELLGTSLRFHPMYITRCMKMVYDCTPLEYITRYRIEQAKRMLMNTDLPIGRIAEESGFETFSFFNKCFRRTTGTSPRDYRKRMWTPD